MAKSLRPREIKCRREKKYANDGSWYRRTGEPSLSRFFWPGKSEGDADGLGDCREILLLEFEMGPMWGVAGPRTGVRSASRLAASEFPKPCGTTRPLMMRMMISRPHCPPLGE